MSQEQELTRGQIDQLDFLHNVIYNVICELCPGSNIPEWDMEIIGEIADLIEEHFVKKGYCTAQEFNPYLLDEEAPSYDKANIQRSLEKEQNEKSNNSTV